MTSRLLLGVGAQLDWITYDQSSGAGQSDGFGFMVGPYLTAKVTDQFYIDAAASWGQADNSVSPLGTYSDDFDSERWLVTGALIGEFSFHEVLVQPEVRLSYYREDTDAYVDTVGTAIPSLTYESGTLEFGPTFSRTFELDNGMALTPSLGARGVWTFSAENTANRFQSNPSTLADERLSASVTAGLALMTADGMHFNVDGSYAGIGDDTFEAWTVRARAGLNW